jgi:hypothetical protein
MFTSLSQSKLHIADDQVHRNKKITFHESLESYNNNNNNNNNNN